jgi:hypothetical protein
MNLIAGVGALALSLAAVAGPCTGIASASLVHTAQVGDEVCGVKIGNVNQELSDNGPVAAFNTESNNFYGQFFHHFVGDNKVCGQIRQLVVGDNGKNGAKAVSRVLIEDNATRQIVWAILIH